jgi:hypothetical protein
MDKGFPSSGSCEYILYDKLVTNLRLRSIYHMFNLHEAELAHVMARLEP